MDSERTTRARAPCSFVFAKMLERNFNGRARSRKKIDTPANTPRGVGSGRGFQDNSFGLHCFSFVVVLTFLCSLSLPYIANPPILSIYFSPT